MIYSYIKSVPGCQQELKKNRLAGGRFGFHMSFSPFLSGEGGEDIGKAVESFQDLRVFVIYLPTGPSPDRGRGKQGSWPVGAPSRQSGIGGVPAYR